MVIPSALSAVQWPAGSWALREMGSDRSTIRGGVFLSGNGAKGEG
jgi:hypothetical protein